MPAPATGHVRLFAHAGVGRYSRGRWWDVPRDHTMLDSWLSAGLLGERDPKGSEAPENLPQRCCGGGV